MRLFTIYAPVVSKNVHAMNTTMQVSENATELHNKEDFIFDQESLYIGVGVGAGLLFSLALLSLVAAVACLGQRRRGGARPDRLTSTVSLARSDFDSYKSGSHYYVSSSNNVNEIVRDEVRQIRKQTRAVPTWPIAHALPASPTTSAARSVETSSDLEDVDELVSEETKVKKFRSRSSSWGRRRRGDNASRKQQARRVSESAIRLPEVKSVFGGTEMTSSSSGSHSLATLSLNFYKPHVRLAELEKYREAQSEIDTTETK